MSANKENKLEIAELFMARASVDRCFYGTIQRLKDENGLPFVFGRINILNGFVCSRAADDKELGYRLDSLVKYSLDYLPYDKKASLFKINIEQYYLN